MAADSDPLQYLGIVYKLARELQWDEESYRDLRGAGHVALFEFYPRWDPDRGVRRSTYLFGCIAGRMRNWIRDQGGARRAHRPEWDAQEGRGGQAISIQALEGILAREGRLLPPESERLLRDEIRSLIPQAGLTPDEGAALARAVARRAEKGRPPESPRLRAAQEKMLRARQRAT